MPQSHVYRWLIANWELAFVVRTTLRFQVSLIHKYDMDEGSGSYL